MYETQTEENATVNTAPSEVRIKPEKCGAEAGKQADLDQSDGDGKIQRQCTKTAENRG